MSDIVVGCDAGCYPNFGWFFQSNTNLSSFDTQPLDFVQCVVRENISEIYFVLFIL